MFIRQAHFLSWLACAAILSGCATQPAKTPSPTEVPAKTVRTATWKIVEWGQLPGWNDTDVMTSLLALSRSCQAAVKRNSLWANVCDQVPLLLNADGVVQRTFIQTQLQPFQVLNADETDEGLVTGYYEPIIKASQARGGVYQTPIHGVPADLLVVDLAGQYPELKGMRLRGRVQGNRVVPYADRAEITTENRTVAPVLYWGADAIEVFFLQIQGSGQLQLPNGKNVRISFAEQNGWPYRSIGRWLVDRGELRLDQASMQGIQSWARSHPERLAELLNANPSYIFFRDLGEPVAAPPGAMGVPLTDGYSLAVDQRSIPLGAPVWLVTTHPSTGLPMNRLMVAQDTGGAIKGGVRADFFWGSGDQAGEHAGRMKQKGRMWILLPKGATPEAMVSK